MTEKWLNFFFLSGKTCFGNNWKNRKTFFCKMSKFNFSQTVLQFKNKREDLGLGAAVNALALKLKRASGRVITSVAPLEVFFQFLSCLNENRSHLVWGAPQTFSNAPNCVTIAEAQSRTQSLRPRPRTQKNPRPRTQAQLFSKTKRSSKTFSGDLQKKGLQKKSTKNFFSRSTF